MVLISLPRPIELFCAFSVCGECGELFPSFLYAIFLHAYFAFQFFTRVGGESLPAPPAKMRQRFVLLMGIALLFQAQIFGPQNRYQPACQALSRGV